MTNTMNHSDSNDPDECPNCDGSGTEKITCPECGGDPAHYPGDQGCPECDGAAWTEVACPICHGSGYR